MPPTTVLRRGSLATGILLWVHSRVSESRPTSDTCFLTKSLPLCYSFPVSPTLAVGSTSKKLLPVIKFFKVSTEAPEPALRVGVSAVGILGPEWWQWTRGCSSVTLSQALSSPGMQGPSMPHAWAYRPAQRQPPGWPQACTILGRPPAPSTVQAPPPRTARRLEGGPCSHPMLTSRVPPRVRGEPGGCPGDVWVPDADNLHECAEATN